MTAPGPGATVADRLTVVRRNIEAVTPAQPVRIVAVTKAFGPEAITAAVAAGLGDVGENYAQELVAKGAALGWDHPDGIPGPDRRPTVHFIGRLQRNKVKRVAPFVDVWQTVDRAILVEELARRVPGARILIQLNATGEADKGGCPPGELDGLVDSARERGLDVIGLMTVGPTEADVDPRPAFSLTREAAERLGLAELSMGMSGDYERAVAEGATMVRLGSVLFGNRPRPGRHDASPSSTTVGREE
ncbi:MAG: YggS family pyridoxal phosphate-dependent enzyme [Acidimicrobiales bacterium]